MSDAVHAICLDLFVQDKGFHDYDTLSYDDIPHKSHIRAQPECTTCHMELTCMGDNVGGGSHYWSLMCDNCAARYTYSSYDFELREYQV